MTSTETGPADPVREVTLLDIDEEPLIISADRILGHGPGVHLRTPPRGWTVPADQVPALIAAIQQIAIDFGEAS